MTSETSLAQTSLFAKRTECDRGSGLRTVLRKRVLPSRVNARASSPTAPSRQPGALFAEAALLSGGS